MDLKKTLKGKCYIPLCFAVMAAALLFCYFVPKELIDYSKLINIETGLDRSIPFIPQWIIVYFLAFLFWAVNGIIIVIGDKNNAVRFTCAFLMSMIVSAVCFVVFPATLTRPEIAGDGFFAQWMRFMYNADSPVCLCPSMHVLISYMCWRGVFRSGNVSRGYRAFNFIFFVLVCFSVVFVKQHVLADIPAGIAVAEICLQTADHIKPERFFRR